MSNQGFFILDREIVNHWVFKKAPEFRIWIYLIRIAQFQNQSKPVMIGKQQRYLKRGEFLCSMEGISNELDVPVRSVRRCLDLFKKNDMIKKTTGRGKGIPYVAKLVNYEKWQGKYKFIKQSSVNHESIKSQYYNNGNNGNNVNNENGTSNQNYYLVCSGCNDLLGNSEFKDTTTWCRKCNIESISLDQRSYEETQKK